MYCAHCGTQCLPDHKFCKGCGAAIGAPGSTLDAPPLSAAPRVAAVSQVAVAPPAASPPPPPPVYAAAPPPPPPPPAGYPQAPPGMVPMLYQAYPGSPQQVYYVPAQGTHAHAGVGVIASLESKIRNLASTEKLEGFSFKEIFKETFMKRGPDAMEEYMSAGSSRTTPPLELVDTNWPRPWMFFRVLAALAIAYAAYYALFLYTLNEKVMVGIIVLAAFAVPVATMTLMWEMNAPRNVSVAKVIEVFVVGGGISIVIATLWYLIPIFGNLPGIVEETSKLLAVIAVTYTARGSRYPYQLNGILFGAAVGAGFACSETLGYGLDVILQVIQSGALQKILAANPQGVSLAVILETLLKPTVSELNMRALLSPFGHPMFTAISAGAFFRVKGDRQINLSMLLDGRFLKAFIIPVVLHSVWDSPLAAGSSNVLIQWVGEGAVAVVGWYVVFTMIQQGLHQVRDMQKAQLQSTLAHVEQTLGLGMVRA